MDTLKRVSIFSLKGDQHMNQHMTITVWYSDFNDFPTLAGRLNWLLNSGYVRIKRIANSFIIVHGDEQYLKSIYQS